MGYFKFAAAAFVLSASVVLPSIATSASLTEPSVTHANTMRTSDAALVRRLPGFSNGYADVNGVRLHYVIGGKGYPLVLLSGWPQTWWSYHKIMPELATDHRVIVVDIRGQGGSSKPASGYDKKTMAADILALVHQLGFSKVDIAGHDIGAMVAYSYAANYPEYTRRLALLDVPHPFEAFEKISVIPQPGDYELSNPNHGLHPWWFAFNQVPGLPEKLLAGRTGILLDWMYDYLNRTPGAISVFDRAVYKAAAAEPGAIRAENGWYQTFAQDIADLKTYGKLQVPVLGIGGISYPYLKLFLDEYTINPQLVQFNGAGHWIAEERPTETIDALMHFFQ
ncbi:alpha/beta fold hydrolase [Burkholderia multivorans]|uniref:alpha/beta fold hydrolase n=1 Tax=Burkholderia multivorans TaxID=87883 RepID=UPI0021C1F460|nr:alpha/beta hydrolase [Burkholderia multivorans]